ncbi:hypothetical protein J437_LFUL005498 [Ladona fulva]|uniref:Uncharacterized protein n=1 Tax=Ladona fulva TaxID=123851 RepID=A0A8K0P0I4_LADFU|nr:hypothetical protein J437_LFUL005498 [Ladona fulva]
MDESGIDLGFDLATITSEDLDLECELIDDDIPILSSGNVQDFMFYKLKSRTVPESCQLNSSVKKYNDSKIYLSAKQDQVR